MRLSGLKMTLRPIVHQMGLVPRIQALRGRSIRLMRQCRDRLDKSKAQSERTGSRCRYSLSAEGLPTWCGYYDKTPFSDDNSRILVMAMTCTKDWSRAAIDMPLRLGFFEWQQVTEGHSLFHPFAETHTWSWQQGCMLQWFPEDPDRLVLYNTLVDRRYGSVVQDIHKKDILKSYALPIYAVDPSGRWGVSLNFSRLERLRPGYGYSNFPDASASDTRPDDDGLWRVDLASGRSEMLLSLRQIADCRPLPSMTNPPHYINHLMFSPNGMGLVFLHLWLSQGRRMNRLMFYDFHDSSLHVVDDAATVSHFNWLADDRLICFRYPHRGPPGYYVYGFGLDHTFECAPMPAAMPTQDGHPSLSPSGDLLVIDTYPDRAGDQALFVFSMREKALREVGRFFSPFRYRGPRRCDLHPRWDRTGSRICFDGTEGDKRRVYIVDLDMPLVAVKSHECGESQRYGAWNQV